MDSAADQIRRQDIICKRLPDEEDGQHDKDRPPIRPELRDRNADRNNEAGERTKVRYEAQ
jgi:hypothetical protein